MITGVLVSVLRSSRQTSKPDMSGSVTSSTTSAGFASSTSRSASAPVSASITSKPSCSQASFTSRLIAASGSTTRMRRAGVSAGSGPGCLISEELASPWNCC